MKYSLPYFVFIHRLGVKLLARQHLRAGNVSSSWNCLAPFFFAQSNFTSAFWAITTQALFLLFPLQAGPSDLTAIPHMWVVSLGSVTTCPHCFAALFSCFLRVYYKVQLCVDFFLLSAVSILLVGSGIAMLQSGGIAVPGSLHCFLWLKPLIVRSYRRPTSILETIFLLLIIISIKSNEWY